LILNLGGMCMLYNHIQNTHSILYLFDCILLHENNVFKDKNYHI
jgi:hypothetical protein